MTENPIDTYIVNYSGEVRHRLEQLRDTCQTAAPAVVEALSYGMPTYKLGGKNLVHFAANKHHIGIYPSPSAIAHFADKLTAYSTSKGTLQLPHSEPLPLDLVREIVEWRVRDMTTDTFPMKG